MPHLPDVTAVFLVRDGQVLLAMKKRGFGAGWWNGYGGKPESIDEAVIETAVRELSEESGGIHVLPESLEKVAEIEFYFLQKHEWDQCLHAFVARTWEGEPTETEEMRPQWFDIAAIPWDAMWPEDKRWILPVLSGEKIAGSITFLDLKGHADPDKIELHKAEL